MHSTPPFDPPYFTASVNEADSQVIETLADGSTRIVPPGERPSITFAATPANAGAGAGDSAAVKPNKPKPATATAKNAAMVLEVPFADKDKAKRLGARWDAARKKWVVPQGSDVQPFKNWWPER